ncbi:capsular polysaccharide biosynthesis protein [Cupriavidus taiwanensis]|uniref:capsular polysaccharide biosynthesis protein n=1 Tax=Cupriavidus taiwanensis TaxID=164546 RepID=UPI0015F24883|nr:capsular polysaccharide biosynthesis protein [Cupriavidus taiwanensis]
MTSFVGEWTFVRATGNKKISKVLGWGYKDTSIIARKYAKERGLPYVSLEDGFIRSVGLGVHGVPPLSLVIDDLGIYYDATRPSRLERIISEGAYSDEILEAADRAIDLVCAHRISKYNHANTVGFSPPTKSRSGARRILVVDQTFGDAAVTFGGGGEAVFENMLNAAVLENPEGEIWVKLHPDVMAGKKKGYLSSMRIQNARVIENDCCPLTLISHFDKVYVVSSQMGFDALLMGKSVTCFGNPWYSGWGQTDDRHKDADAIRVRRGVRRTVSELFAAAYLVYARYVNPVSGKVTDIFDTISWILRNRQISEASQGSLYCVGMSFWKRSIVKPFLSVPGNRLYFAKALKESSLNRLGEDARIVLWGRQNSSLAVSARNAGIPITRLEDGFIRSSGLGSDLYAPLSVCVDDNGIYYDPESGSDLERLLNSHEFEDEQLTRARSLIARLLELKISKYNVGVSFEVSPDAKGRRILLVPGQVEDDESIRTGSPIVFRNRDLLSMVRKNNPDAWIIYKPHPDVVAGNREGRVADRDLLSLANEVVLYGSISDCIAAVEEVHTMTSQSGFEALLMGKAVHCYGAPFYAGWGLTVDHVYIPHRCRDLSIQELVYIALCRFPRYRLPAIAGFCAVEDVVDYLATVKKSERRIGSHWLGRRLRKLRQIIDQLAFVRP